MYFGITRSRKRLRLRINRLSRKIRLFVKTSLQHGVLSIEAEQLFLAAAACRSSCGNQAEKVTCNLTALRT